MIRWGVAGLGAMAAQMIGEFAHVPDARVVAVASRDADKAQRFADEHGVGRAHGSYADLFADADVDVVYIATPHPQHRDLAVAALDAGKAVLIEKSFAATVAGATEIIETARDRRLFAMEGMWTRFLPTLVEMKRRLDEGAIGEVRAVQGDLGALRAYDPTDRLFAPELGGGAMLDLGVYALSFVQHVLGTPSWVVANGSRYPNGVDAEAAMLLGYEDGRSASVHVALRTPGPGRMIVLGTEGFIEVLPRFHHPDAVVLHRGGSDERIELPRLGRGYAHELIEVNRCLTAGLLESPTMPLDDTLAVTNLMEDALSQLGVEHRDA